MNEIAMNIAMRPPHPGRFIMDEVLEPAELTITAAAGALGVRRASLSDLVNGKVRLSPEMALRMEKAFGVNMDILPCMQAWFDAVEMRDRSDDIDVAPFNPVES